MEEATFTVGETVKAIDPNAACFGEIGTVRSVEPAGGKVVYDVLFPHRGNGPVHFDAGQLEKV